MAKKKYYDKNQDEHAPMDGIDDMEENRGTSNVKIEVVLLAIIAVALVIQTFYMISGSGGSDTPAYVPANNNSPAAMSQPQAQPQAQPQQMSPQQQIQQQMDQQGQPQISTQQPPANPQQADPNATAVTYSATTHDFGAVSSNATNLSHTFTVTNDGSKPLAYTNVRGDAGITVTSYPTSPIPPGGTGKISVTFDPSQAKGTGNQAYNVHMDANTNPGHQHLVIQAAVN